jgi:hypothetical protein
MINNSKMYNEKQALNYQIDLYKDTLDEHYETLNEIKRQLKAKCTDFDLQKRTLNNLQEENNRLIHILTNCEKLIQVNLFFKKKIIRLFDLGIGPKRFS